MSDQTGLFIREVTPEDREEVLNVLLEAYLQYETIIPESKWELYRQSILDSFDNDGPVARIVAESDGTIVGSVQLFLSSDVAYGVPGMGIESPIIRYLAVSPKQRGKGIATALIRESARRAVDLGASWLHLHTSDMMESAVKLYERLGFERAFDTDIMNGETLVKGYRLDLKAASVPLIF
jgi:GNAT superfamily N-acetyltransferase